MKFTVCLFACCLVWLILSCSHPQESSDSYFTLREKNRINNFVSEYLFEVPTVNLPHNNYTSYKYDEYEINGSVDSANLKQGYWKIFNTKSRMLYQGFFVNNKKSEWWDIFLSNKLICCGKYELNNKQGYWRYLRVGNETMKFVHYKSDTLIGLAQEFTTDSILLSEGSFEKGLKNGYWKFYYPNGRIKEQGYFYNNFKSGWWQSYDDKTRLTEEASYSQDEISGYVKRYINGIISEEGKQFNGRKRGSWKYYDLNGVQNRIHEYEE